MQNSILIITDYQNDFVAPNGKVSKRIGNNSLKASQAIEQNIQKLIANWHKEKRHILFLMSDYNSKRHKGAYRKHREIGPYGNTAIKGTFGHQLYKIKPQKGYKTIIKNFFDGFYHTELDEYLKKNGIENIYLCGINTDVCIFHTSISAMNRGYNVHIIESATVGTSKENKKIFLDYLEKFVGVKVI